MASLISGLSSMPSPDSASYSRVALVARDVVGKRTAERDHRAHHVRQLQRQIARIDAAETPADDADLAAGRLVNSLSAGRATRRACRRRRRDCGPCSRHGCRSRVLSDSAASAPSRGRWRESPAAPAPDDRRPSARASTAATAAGSNSVRTGFCASASIRNRLGARSLLCSAGASSATATISCPSWPCRRGRPWSRTCPESVRRSWDRR